MARLTSRDTQSRYGVPNFLIIGAARSGTTTLYCYLQEHPDIYLHSPKRPEPHFFLKEEEYAKGIDYYSKKYFAQLKEQTAIGEASTSYICHESVAARIHKHLPAVKLIAVLRHPVDRAFSGYWHTSKAGLETLSFDEAVYREVERQAKITDPFLQQVRPFAYIERGFYYKQLSVYLNDFAKTQILVLLFDDLVQHPLQVTQEVFSFLGVDATFIPTSLGRIENRSTPPACEMSPETRSMLLDLYSEDIEQLSTFLKRDLSSWKK